jgi:glycosyltransferase involved in cell wall biosynthesis
MSQRESKRVCIVVLNTFVGDSRVEKTASTLSRAGAHVEVIARHGPGLPVEEARDGYLVRRIPLRGPIRRNTIRRIALFIEFVIKARRYVRGADTVWCNDLGAIMMARLWKLTLRGRRRYVYDSHEFAINDRPFESRWSIFAKWVAEALSIRVANAVVCVSPSIADEYARMYRIKRPHLVLNCPPFEERRRTVHLRVACGVAADQQLFLYQGGFSRGRGLEMAMDAFESRADNRAVLVLMGSGELEEEIRARASRCERIRFHPAVSSCELSQWTSSADCGLCLTEDTCLNHKWCLPNKLFQYLMAGLPVIAFGTLEVRQLVERYRIGIVTPTDDAGGLGVAIDAFVRRQFVLDPNGLDAFREQFCWERQESVVRDAAGV